MADQFPNATWYLTLIRLATMASTLLNLTTRQVTKTLTYAVKSLSTDAMYFLNIPLCLLSSVITVSLFLVLLRSTTILIEIR